MPAALNSATFNIVAKVALLDGIERVLRKEGPRVGLMGLRLATLMGLEPKTSYVTGMFRFVSPLRVDVCKRPSCRAPGRGAYSANVRRSLPISAPYATPEYRQPELRYDCMTPTRWNGSRCLKVVLRRRSRAE